jgi:hypothetical protein
MAQRNGCAILARSAKLRQSSEFILLSHAVGMCVVMTRAWVIRIIGSVALGVASKMLLVAEQALLSA